MSNRLQRFRQNSRAEGMQRIDLYVPIADAPALRAQARQLAQLQRLVVAAQQDFGAQCFWNIPAQIPTLALVRLTIERLRKHGGMAGWRRAQVLSAALQAHDADALPACHPAHHGA